MSETLTTMIDDFNIKLKEVSNMADYYLERFKEHEKIMIKLKENINELERIKNKDCIWR